MPGEDEYLGAVASNAGDDFHILWATREVLRLLDPASDVAAVKVEGLPSDQIHAELGEHGQAVDVALTHTVAGRRRYRYLQLKHSTTNPAAAWTWARLLSPRAKTKPQSSVLGKLAGLMKAVRFQGDFSILTNQPLADDVAKDVARLIGARAKRASGDAALIARLTKQLGLGERELLRFLRAWDLSGFASASRLSMEGEILQRLVAMVDADARDDANAIARRIATLMLPESRNEPPVTRELLLIWLGVGSKGMAFPAPSSINPANPYLRRGVAAELRDALLAARSRPLRVHARGGCGKTSLLCDLPALLPAGSELFLYDSYGGGLFLASDQKRHLPEQAFVQIGNEIAARLRTPLLVRRQTSLDVFEAFRNRVIVAAGLLADRDPDALLVLGFDAVDNARTGANHWHEPCFLDALAQASGWPANVRILVSCRTARRDAVGDKELFSDFEVQPFDVDEVGALVALWQPGWSKASAASFHDLTGGNPRRLVYAVKDLPADGEAKAIARLMPKAEGIDPLFERRVAEAGVHLGRSARVWGMLDALARLPRPVPAHILGALAELTPAEISDIAADVGGIVERAEGWSFHDEDFEAFVIERAGSDAAELLGRAADLLMARKSEDRYAAAGVAEVLVAAGRFDTLYALVTEDEPPSKILSPLEAQFVWSRRLALAIRCCREASDIANACSLLIASAEAIRRAKLLEELTVEHLELSLRFAGDEANRLILVGQGYRRKRAQLRVELARQLAATRPEAARTNLRWWHAHIRDARLGDERDRPHIGAREIASEYEAWAILDGETKAFSRLFNWRPKTYLSPTLAILAARSGGTALAALRDAIAARRWPPRALAPLMAAALFAGAKVTEPVMRDGLARLAGATGARWREPNENSLAHTPALHWDEAALLLCERAIAHARLRPMVEKILANALPEPELDESHHLYRLRSAGARHARAYALRERLRGKTIDVGDWLPPLREVQKPPQRMRVRQREERSPEQYWNETREETRTAFTRFVGAARANLALAADPDQSWQALAKALDVSQIYSERPIRDPDAALLLLRAHLIHAALAGGDVADLVPKIRKILRSWSADSIARALDLAKTLALIPHGHNAALTLLTALAEEIEAAPLSATDRVKQLSDCATIALPLDEDLAGHLFAKAVEAAGTVDHEAQSALAAAGAIAAAGLGGARAERAGLAIRLADAAGSVAATLDLGGDFNWPSVVGWITRADLPSGLAVAARLQDRGIASFRQTLDAVFAGGGLSLAQRYALAQLSGDGHPDRDTAFGDAENLPAWAITDLLAGRLNEGDPKPFLEDAAALANVASAAAGPALAGFDGYRTTFNSWQPQAPEPEPEPASASRSEDETPAALGDVEAIRAALIEGAGERGPSAHQYRLVADRVTNLKLRVPFLEIAREVSGTDGELGKAIAAILPGWSNYPPVVAWAKAKLPAYLSGSLKHLFEWNYRESEPVEAALAATGLDDAGQADILLDGIERGGEGMSADLLLVLTGMVAGRAPAASRIKLYGELLQRVEARASHPTEVPLQGVVAPDNVPESVARTLFAAMGDMDRRVRWRAAYGALALMRGGDPAWDRLVQCLGATSETEFSGAPFYRYAALEQLLMVLERGALDQPEAVARHADLILATIRQEPHIVLRELGRSLLLALDAAGATQLAPADRQLLTTLNRSQLAPAKPAQPRVVETGFLTRQERPYRFDDTDAIPYWYRPAMRLFGIPLDSFLDRMQHWLHDKWGYGDKATYWDHEPRAKRMAQEGDHISRRHGSRPTVERLSYHIEWHAMMCVVGEMIVDHPLVDRPDIQEQFEEWLQRALPAVAPRWASDLRGPPPFEPRFWRQAPPERPPYKDREAEREEAALAWGRSVGPALFDAEICDAKDDIVVAADFTLRWSDAEQTVDIHSALVTPKTAMALGQALTTIHDRMDYALPGAYHDDIEHPEFTLRAWFHHDERDARGDKHDVRRGSVSGIPVNLVGLAQDQGLRFDFARLAWCAPDGVVALSLTQWGSDETPGGKGWRVTATRAFLTDFLKKSGMSLILNAEIARTVRGEELDTPTRWALFVLDANGTLTRVKRHRRGLGPYLVRRERLTRSVDTLGRWILHYAAELDVGRAQAGLDEQATLTQRIAALCQSFTERNAERDEDDFDFG